MLRNVNLWLPAYLRQRRKWGLIPRFENADVSAARPVTNARVANWTGQRIGVIGRSDWVFIKVHTHGCQESNFPVLFDGRLHEALKPLQLHYVTAREVYNLVKTAEAGQTGEPEHFRNFVLPPPEVCGTVRANSQ